MLGRLLILGASIGLLMATGALDGCGRRHHHHPAVGHSYSTADGTAYQDGPGVTKFHRVDRLNSARVERGAERATREFTEGVTAIAEGLGMGVVEGARDGARDARVGEGARDGARDARVRHRRHRFSYSYETADPDGVERVSRD